MGSFAALLKLGPKLLAVAGKLAKSLKVTKVALAGASLWAYASIWSWQFAVVIVAAISFHEYGHVWAMQRYGMKTKGFYLLPFVGGAAVPAEEFPSEGALAWTALMGPIFGCVLALLAGAIHVTTDAPLWAAIAGWIAMLNLFNLLPVNPLDGGRIMRSVAYSIGSWLGTLFLALGVVAAIYAAYASHFFIFGFLAIVGGLELVFERRRTSRLPTMPTPAIPLVAGAYALLIVVLWGLMHAMQHEPGAALALEALKH